MKTPLVLVLAIGLTQVSHGRPTIVAPSIPVSLQDSITSSFLHLGRTTLTTQAAGASTRAGGSALSVAGMFALSPPSDQRDSGWIIGASAGLTDFVFENERYLSPSFYFWELMAGRASLLPKTLVSTGLRGYFEFGLRDQRPQMSQTLSASASELGYRVIDHNQSLFVRLGASNDQKGQGLVEQHAPQVAVAFELGLYLPLSQQKLLWTVNAETTVRFFSDYLRAGFEGSILRSQLSGFTDLYEPLRSRYRLGTVFDARFSDRYLARLHVGWNAIRSQTRTLTAGAPTVRLTLAVGY